VPLVAKDRKKIIFSAVEKSLKKQKLGWGEDMKTTQGAGFQLIKGAQKENGASYERRRTDHTSCEAAKQAKNTAHCKSGAKGEIRSRKREMELGKRRKTGKNSQQDPKA